MDNEVLESALEVDVILPQGVVRIEEELLTVEKRGY